MGRKMTLLVYALLATCVLSGCGKIGRVEVGNGYATDFSVSPTEYTIFVSKNVSVATNILYTRMTMASKVISDIYAWDDEIENAEEAVSKVQAVVEALTVTMPPQGYESDRQMLLDMLEQSRASLEDYVTHLKERDTEAIKSDITLMESSALSMGGEANVAYQ